MATVNYVIIYPDAGYKIEMVINAVTNISFILILKALFVLVSIPIMMAARSHPLILLTARSAKSHKSMGASARNAGLSFLMNHKTFHNLSHYICKISIFNVQFS